MGKYKTQLRSRHMIMTHGGIHPFEGEEIEPLITIAKEPFTLPAEVEDALYNNGIPGMDPVEVGKLTAFIAKNERLPDDITVDDLAARIKRKL